MQHLSRKFMIRWWRRWCGTSFTERTDFSSHMAWQTRARPTPYRVTHPHTYSHNSCPTWIISLYCRHDYGYGQKCVNERPVCLHAGSAGEAGLLPRALVSVFTTLSGQLYPRGDLKPVLKQEVRRLSDAEVRTEEDRRHALLREVHVHRGRG